MQRLAALAAASLLCASPLMGSSASVAATVDQAALESRFDAQIKPAELDAWMKTMAAEPNHVGSVHDKANAEYQLGLFRQWGWDARIETFEVLYPTPLSETLELKGPHPFKATLQEPPIPGDASSTRLASALPAYVAFQGDGDVTADLVYVNYGMPDDYKALERLGISVKGKIAIADAPTILKIPVLPISYADAEVFLKALGGPVAPAAWRGSLGITYHVGPGPAQVHLAVKSDWSLKTIYDVIAVMKGSTLPDQWVVRGNHHDGWVFGASDPLSGQVALMAEAKAIGALAKQGWKPKRTLVYASWDAEEPMLLGSTEWAETHGDELKKKAVIYINSDGNGRGFLQASGSHDFQRLVNQVAADVADPETGVPVGQRVRARLRVEALATGATEEAKADAKIAADPAKDFPIGPLGSGSDYSSFIQHLGLPALNVGFGGEGMESGVYHSAYDDYEHHSRWVDPGFVYDALLAKLAGRLVMRVADADAPLQQAGGFADAVSTYLTEVRKLADSRRDEADVQEKLLRDHAFQLAADPTKSSGLPTALDRVPHFELAALEDSVDRLKRSAKAYDEALARAGPALPADRLGKLQTLMLDIDQTLLSDVGLPGGRSWYRNMIYAPGRFTGYGAKTLPGVREAIEDRRWADADTYAKLTAEALNRYSDRLDQATALLNGA